jgi:hypothetical protein
MQLSSLPDAFRVALLIESEKLEAGQPRQQVPVDAHRVQYTDLAREQC